MAFRLSFLQLNLPAFLLSGFNAGLPGRNVIQAPVLLFRGKDASVSFHRDRGPV